jgi:predicted histidine transporter YuiF (NhaC family)
MITIIFCLINLVLAMIIKLLSFALLQYRKMHEYYWQQKTQLTQTKMPKQSTKQLGK